MSFLRGSVEGLIQHPRPYNSQTDCKHTLINKKEQTIYGELIEELDCSRTIAVVHCYWYLCYQYDCYYHEYQTIGITITVAYRYWYLCYQCDYYYHKYQTIGITLTVVYCY